MEMYQQQIENLRIEKEELEEVVAALESDYDELAEENDELKLLLYRLHQVIGDISEHFEEYSHLCRTMFGICNAAAPHLDTHKRRTVNGLVKKTIETGEDMNDYFRRLSALMEQMCELDLFDIDESDEACDLM
jgi:chromosome segregation ATPase